MDQIKSKIVINVPLSSVYDLLKRIMPGPTIDVEEARVEGRDAVHSLIHIMEDQPFKLELLKELVSAKAIVLSQREDETMFGNALGFNWSYEKETSGGEDKD